MHPKSSIQPAGKSIDPEVANNNRLTALTGALLFVLLALLGITILDVQQNLPQHFLLGFVLVPPTLLKMGTTGRRFMRYYAGDRRYEAAGPPPLFMRLLAPIVVLSTVVVFATGIELWLFGLRFGSEWVGAHKASFFVWIAATGLHVLGHLGRTADTVTAELSSTPPAAFTRRSLVIGSLVVGAAIAAASLVYPSPFIFPND